jgi:hypothetical protein
MRSLESKRIAFKDGAGARELSFRCAFHNSLDLALLIRIWPRHSGFCVTCPDMLKKINAFASVGFSR